MFYICKDISANLISLAWRDRRRGGARKNVQNNVQKMCKVNFDRSWLTFLQSRVEMTEFSSGEDVRSRFFNLCYVGARMGILLHIYALDVLSFQPLVFC